MEPQKPAGSASSKDTGPESSHGVAHAAHAPASAVLLATHQFESVERAQLWAAREAQLALARREEQVYRDHASALQAASLDASRRYAEARDAAVRAQQQSAGDAEAFHRS